MFILVLLPPGLLWESNETMPVKQLSKLQRPTNEVITLRPCWFWKACFISCITCILDPRPAQSDRSFQAQPEVSSEASDIQCSLLPWASGARVMRKPPTALRMKPDSLRRPPEPSPAVCRGQDFLQRPRTFPLWGHCICCSTAWNILPIWPTPSSSRPQFKWGYDRGLPRLPLITATPCLP